MGKLISELSAVRNEGNRDRENCVIKILDCLGYGNNTSVSVSEFDSFLINAVSERFGGSVNKDIILMAFGLLNGYHYKEITEIEDRRAKYLTNSEHLQTRARKKESYVDATIKRKKALRDNLRKMEDGLIEDLAYFLVKQEIESYIEKNTAPITIPQPSYILLAHEPKSSPQQPDTPPEKDPPPGESEVPLSTPPPNPQGFRLHIGRISIGPLINISTKPRIKVNLSWIRASVSCAFVAILAVLLLWYFHPSAPPAEDISSAQTILVVNGDIILAPNNLFELAAALPVEDTGAPLRYTSSDPDIVAVGEHNGMLHAAVSHPVGGVQTTDITIKGENGATVTKTVSVNFDSPNNNSTYDTPDNSGSGHNIFPDSNSGPGHNIQLDDFVPEFTVTQKIRIAGDTEWHNYVDAKVGDELEIQFEYRNTSENEHVNVAVRDILPANLGYIPGSTTLYTTQTSTGLKKEDGIVDDGIYIGTYGSNSNAWVRFRVRVADTNLTDGVTGLVNWSQAYINGVTLQDYVTVRVAK